MGMRKKSISAKEFNGPKKLPSGSDSTGPHLRLKPKKKVKRK